MVGYVEIILLLIVRLVITEFADIKFMQAKIAIRAAIAYVRIDFPSWQDIQEVTRPSIDVYWPGRHL